jgi:hypothetical protein
MQVLVVNHVSLDGVLQGPGRPDEDTRDGFQHGGWAPRATDPALAAAIGERMGRDFSWLFGRRSYEDMLGHWNRAPVRNSRRRVPTPADQLRADRDRGADGNLPGRRSGFLNVRARVLTPRSQSFLVTAQVADALCASSCKLTSEHVSDRSVS